MLSVMKRIVTRVGRKQSGFTLVELLVVVGIIVALAAVIIPNVIQFADRGDTAAAASELATVQTAIDTWMADQNLILIASNSGSNAEADFSGAGTINLSNYLRATLTDDFYCWDTGGLVTVQQDAATPVCP